jgi:hypothetical protein
MDIGFPGADGLANGGASLGNNPQQQQAANNAFAGNSGGGVFMGVSGAHLRT